jgi:hypothetical protein
MGVSFVAGKEVILASQSAYGILMAPFIKPTFIHPISNELDFYSGFTKFIPINCMECNIIMTALCMYGRNKNYKYEK